MRNLRIPVLTLALTAVSLTGCHSAYVEATVANRSTQTISLVEVDYPSASFGTQMLAPGQDFHYRFKVLGSGVMKLVYTDSAHHEQTSEGPTLNEGAEGPITITITPTGTVWHPTFTTKP